MYHVIIDGSSSMTGAGKSGLQKNCARFIRQFINNAPIKFWHWQENVQEISPISPQMDISFVKNQGKTNELALIDFLLSSPSESCVFILSDGFSLKMNRKNQAMIKQQNHHIYWIMIGPDAMPLSKDIEKIIKPIHAEDVFCTLQNLVQPSVVLDRPLTIDPAWIQHNAKTITTNTANNDEDEW